MMSVSKNPLDNEVVCAVRNNEIFTFDDYDPARGVSYVRVPMYPGE